jgi:hypothetical protein
MNKNYDELISDSYLNDLPIAQGGNSQVYKVNLDGQNYGIKYYDSKQLGFTKLNHEYSCLKNIGLLIPKYFNKVVFKSDIFPAMIYEWAEGANPTVIDMKSDKILEIFFLLQETYRVKSYCFPKAIQSIEKLSDVFSIMNVRLSQLSKDVTFKEQKVILNEFNSIKELLESDFEETFFDKQTLSLSDFGSHNLIIQNETNLVRAIDLEFFGRDTSYKLICDILLHPKNLWGDNVLELYLNFFVDNFNLDRNRISLLLKPLALNWACIILKKQMKDSNPANSSKGFDFKAKYISWLLQIVTSKDPISDVLSKSGF